MAGIVKIIRNPAFLTEEVIEKRCIVGKLNVDFFLTNTGLEWKGLFYRRYNFWRDISKI